MRFKNDIECMITNMSGKDEFPFADLPDLAIDIIMQKVIHSVLF